MQVLLYVLSKVEFQIQSCIHLYFKETKQEFENFQGLATLGSPDTEDHL